MLRISSVKEIGLVVLIYFSFLGFAIGQAPASVVPNYNHSGAVSLPTVSVNFITFSVNTDDLTIAIDSGPDNFVYNLTFGNGIQKRNPDGSLVNSSFISGLSSPLDFAIDKDGFFYVADYSEDGTCAQNGKIKVFNPNGSLSRTIYTGFYRPLGVDIDSDGNIYVAEYNSPGTGCENEEFSRVSVYNSSGNRIAQNRLVDRPYRIAVSSDKTVYLSQEGNNDPAVLIMDQNLRITGSLPNIESAGSVVVDSFDYIHVVEYSGRIDFSRFINFEDLSFGEIQDIAEEIDKGTKDKAFGIKVFNPSEGYEYTYKEEIDFPIDISFNSCDKMYVNNAEVFGRSSFIGYIPEKIEFDLEIYERTPAFDITDPVINCPADITVQAESGDNFAIVNYNDATATDLCGVTVTKSGQESGSQFMVGEHEVKFTATDAFGNTSTCSLKITVNPSNVNAPPTITCPTDITKNTDQGTCGAVVTFSPPEVSDDGGTITPTRTDNTGLNSGDLFPVGVTTISYQADDGVNAPVTCSFTITITDNEDPVINCPENINESIAFGESGKTINYSIPSISDNCGGPSIIQTSGLGTGEVFPKGTTTNTFVVDDGNGNSASCSFTVTITEEEEDTPPTITCPANITQNTDMGACGGVVTFSPPEVTDDGGEITPTRTDNTGLNSGDLFPVGETTISYQADDGVNDPVSCSFTITITDNEKPVFTGCPSETIVIFVQNGETGAVFEAPQIEASDNCGDVNVVQTRGPEGGATLPLGFTDFEYTATDNNGLTATCEFQVEVREESAALEISCPGSVPVPADESCVYIVPDLSDVVSTNIAGASIVQDIAAGSDFDPDSDLYVNVTATFEDQTESCRIYLSPVDEEDPVARCIGDYQISLAEGESIQLNAQDFDAGSTDNCQIASFNIDRTSLSSSDAGENVITFTVKDAAGNLDTCEVIVEVVVEEPGEIDFSCLIVEYKVSPDDNCEYFLPDFGDILEFSPAEANFEQSVAAGTQLFEDLEVEVSVSFNGESKTCNLYVSLLEDEPQAICKADFQIQLEEGETIVLSPEDIDNGSFANCSDISLSLDKTEFTIADIGTNLVTLTVTDGSGNTASCQTTVTVVTSGSGVNQPPVGTDEEYTTNINTTLEVSASTGVLVNDTDPDNDELTAILQDDVSNGALVLNADGSFIYTPDLDFTGQDYFTYVANDGELNSNVIFVSISVENNNADFSCIERITLSLDSEGSAGLDIDDLYTGNAEGMEFELNQSLFSCADIGENTVTLVYTGRQEGSCEIVVEVLDMSAPVLALKDIEISLSQAGVATITFNDLDAGSRDNCNAEVNYILSGSAFTCKDIGENQIMVTAEDSSGNSSTRIAKVTVIDNAGYCTDFGEGSEYIFIYPNPNTGSFKIATPADEQITRIEVFDHRGRFIAARDYESTAIEYAMELGPLQESVYVVKIVTNQRTLTKRFIFKY